MWLHEIVRMRARACDGSDDRCSCRAAAPRNAHACERASALHARHTHSAKATADCMNPIARACTPVCALRVPRRCTRAWRRCTAATSRAPRRCCWTRSPLSPREARAFGARGAAARPLPCWLRSPAPAHCVRARMRISPHACRHRSSHLTCHRPTAPPPLLAHAALSCSRTPPASAMPWWRRWWRSTAWRCARRWSTGGARAPPAGALLSPCVPLLHRVHHTTHRVAAACARRLAAAAWMPCMLHAAANSLSRIARRSSG